MEESEFKKLIEEYKICQADVSRLESHIWQSSTVLNVFSGVGLIGKFYSRKCGALENFFYTTALAILIIMTSLVWNRLSKRWWSIQHLKFNRMKELDPILGFKQAKLVDKADMEKLAYIDKSICDNQWGRYWFTHDTSNVLKDEKFKRLKSKYFDDRAIHRFKNYECRGNQPAIRMLLYTNCLIWVGLALASVITLLKDSGPAPALTNLTLVLILSVILVVWVILYWIYYRKS